MNLRKRGWGRRYWLPLVHRKPVRLRNIGPVVTFTFDDFPRTAYTVGGTILKEFGARGTFYAALGLVNSTNLSGEHFRIDDLYSLVGDGHELGSHTLHHLSSHNLSAPGFLQEVREGRSALQQVLGVAVSNNFAYPYGAVTLRTKRDVGREMLSCRGNYRGVNGPLVDLSLLRANPLYGDTEQLDFVRRLVSANAELNGWLIFYTHEVRKSPSQHGCTPALLESAIKIALDSSMRLLTVDEVLARLDARSPKIETLKGEI